MGEKKDKSEEDSASHWSSCHHGRWTLSAYPLGLLFWRWRVAWGRPAAMLARDGNKTRHRAGDAASVVFGPSELFIDTVIWSQLYKFFLVLSLKPFTRL